MTTVIDVTPFLMDSPVSHKITWLTEFLVDYDGMIAKEDLPKGEFLDRIWRPEWIRQIPGVTAAMIRNAGKNKKWKLIKWTDADLTSTSVYAVVIDDNSIALMIVLQLGAEVMYTDEV